MADFEDNNPFAGNDLSNDFDHLTVSHDNSMTSDSQDEHDSSDNNGFYRDHSATYSPAPPSKAYSSRIEQILMETPDLHIDIIDAGKSHEGNSRGFIAYTIKLLDLSVRRRYSEFESLRTTLTRLFPTLIIPPIPEKHTMSDYAASPTRAKEDTSIIEHRQRMLSVFLNRCNSMKQVRESPVFQRFLDPNSSWSEVLNGPPVSNLPKHILKAPPLNPSQPTDAHAYLPLPSSSAKLSSADDPASFDEAETNAKEYESVIVGGIEKVNKRIVKRYGDMASDCSDLGSRLNAFSLEEDSQLANAIEKIGQATDNCYLSTEALISALSSTFNEPLGESAQFAVVVRNVLKYRRQKALQLEMTGSLLTSKRGQLESLERSEKEAQRINNYLRRDGSESQAGLRSSTDTENSASEVNSEFPPTHASENTVSEPKKSSGPFKLLGLGKLNHAIHGIIDVDPESSRRSNIGKTREEIAHLEEALKVAETDAQQASESVKEDLERFQHTKCEDLRKIMKAYIKCHVEWAQKNLDSWQEAKAAIAEM